MKLKNTVTTLYESSFEHLPLAAVLFNNKEITQLNITAKQLLFSARKLTDRQQLLIKNNIHRQLIKFCVKGLKNHTFYTFSIETVNKKIISFEARCNKLNQAGKIFYQAVLLPVALKNKVPAQDHEDILKGIESNSRDVIFYFEGKSNLKFISDSSKAILEYSPDEIKQNPGLIKSLLKPINKLHAAARKTGKPDKKTIAFKLKSGQIRHLEVVMNAVFKERNKLAGVAGTIRDISERVETEALLVETKNKFDLITNNSGDIIAFYTFYPKQKYLYVSPNIYRILGYRDKEVLSDSSFFFNRLTGPKDNFHKSDKILKNYQRKNIVKNHHYSFKILNAKKEELWLENSLAPITNKKGKIVFFMNILRDITEQKESELEIENQYYNYKNLLDHSPVAYMIHDHGVCVFLNNAMADVMKAKNKNQVLGKFTLDFFEGRDRKKALERIQQLYDRKVSKNKYHQYFVRDLEGNLLEIEVKSILLKFNNRDCILSLVNNLSDQRQREKEKVKTLITETANKQLQKEIKERHEAEKSLTEKSAHLTSILESSTHLIWTVNEKYEITSYNQNFHQVVLQQHKVNIKPGDKIDELLTNGRDEYIKFWYPRYKEAFLGKKLDFVKEDLYRGSVFRKIFINPIYNEKSEITEISCIANDITDSKVYEQKLLNQTGKLSAIFDSSHHYIWTIDKEGKLTSFNKNYYDLVTALYNTKPFLGLVLNRGVLANDREYTELLQFHYDKAFMGLATSFEIETRDKDNKNVYLEIFLNPILDNERVTEVSGIAHNITEKKHVQQRMEQSLKEKEVLLREVHHRVKNNMQVISSILNLQSSYVSDEYALTLLKESQNRIKTMAYIHESLYQNKSFTSVNFSDYVHTLVKNIVQSYSYSIDKIALHLQIQDLTLSLDSSIPAGLIINELITNAIKHAFPGSKKGVITFNLRSENNLVFLELKDNGVGFAPGLDFENSHSLGLQLVNTLIEQIEGELKFTSEKDKGTEVIVTFKM